MFFWTFCRKLLESETQTERVSLYGLCMTVHHFEQFVNMTVLLGLQYTRGSHRTAGHHRSTVDSVQDNPQEC